MSDDTSTQQKTTDAGERAGNGRSGSERPDTARAPQPDRSLRNFGLGFFGIAAVVVIVVAIIEVAAG